MMDNASLVALVATAVPRASAPMDRVVAAAASPFPPSADNSVWLYGQSLASLFILLGLNLGVIVWMAREIRRDLPYVPLLSWIMAYRVMIAAAGMTGALRNAPEVVYMLAWAEVDGPTMRLIMFGKRVADSVAALPGLTWTTLALLSYPAIANILKTDARRSLGAIMPWQRMVWPAIAIFILVTVAMLVAIGKLLMGVPIQ